MNIDLHSHTTASDGSLPAAELLALVRETEVELFAITDHDTLDGYRAVRNDLAGEGCRLISGIELSTQWQGVGVHIVGLNFDPDHAAMLEAVEKQSEARMRRAELITQRLKKQGLDVDLGRVQEIAGREAAGRPHFATHLVEIGAVTDEPQAFKKWLGKGKVGDVKQTWAEFEQVIDWIVQAGGVAVLAHPLKYQLTNSKLKRLLQDFKEAGGQAIEVISGAQTAAQTQHMAGLADFFGFYASAGSDFHRPNQSWSPLGRVDAIPATLNPVWRLF